MRLPVLGQGEGWIALEKPAGIGLRLHPWDPGTKDLDRALNEQLRAGKGELLRTGAALFASAFYLDPEISGLGLFATSAESQAALRNAVGSEQALFRFLFVLPGCPEPADEIICETPLLTHHTKAKMVPSSAKGKKTRTCFRRLAQSGAGWELWEASATLLRPHQVRIHARLSGLAIPGDLLYDGPPLPVRGDIRRIKGRAATGPVFGGMPLHLDRLTVKELGIDVQAPAPKALRASLRQLGLLESFEAASVSSGEPDSGRSAEA